MLQQTRVEAVVPFYERFLEAFPTVESLAQVPLEQVLKLWSGLGYYSRARNLQKAAQEIVARHDGRFPCALEHALALPGIGSYTAAAILSIAYQKELAVLDGNVARVVARLGALRGDLRANGTWNKLQTTAEHLLVGKSPGDWNQAMMELGATLCTPRSPRCLLCPVGEFCEARKKGLAHVIPEKRAKRGTVEVALASLVLLDSRGNTLLLPPPKGAAKSAAANDVPTLVSRMWHFPTVPVRQETAAAELRKFVEETFLSGKQLTRELEPLRIIRHAVTYRSIRILPFLAEVEKMPKIRGARILPLSEISHLAISNLTRKVAHAAEKRIPPAFAKSAAAGKEKAAATKIWSAGA
jgi:A/G-specific adenine glycosylase